MLSVVVKVHEHWWPRKKPLRWEWVFIKICFEILLVYGQIKELYHLIYWFDIIPIQYLLVKTDVLKYNGRGGICVCLLLWPRWCMHSTPTLRVRILLKPTYLKRTKEEWPILKHGKNFNLEKKSGFVVQRHTWAQAVTQIHQSQKVFPHTRGQACPGRMYVWAILNRVKARSDGLHKIENVLTSVTRW